MNNEIRTSSFYGFTNGQAALFGAAVAFIVGVVTLPTAALLAMTLFVERTAGVSPFLSNPVANVADVEFTVPATATILTSITPTSGTWQSYSSIYIANSLTTCIRVGGPTLTTTSGFDIGSGCRDGVGVTLDATGDIYVMDDGGGTVAGVDVIRGKM